MSDAAPCPLCADDGGLVLWRQAELRVVRVTGAEAVDFPGFYRVIWNTHVAEWTDLSDAEQVLMMRAVGGVERAVREYLRPTKVNLASLGNMVPHLHWHVVARFEWDSHFPAPLWATARREVVPSQLAMVASRLPACDDAIAGGVF